MSTDYPHDSPSQDLKTSEQVAAEAKRRLFTEDFEIAVQAEMKRLRDAAPKPSEGEKVYVATFGGVPFAVSRKPGKWDWMPAFVAGDAFKEVEMRLAD